MKTIVFINGANVGSTGRIVYGISALARQRGWQTYHAYPRSRNLLPARDGDLIISSVPVKFLSTRAAWLTGLNGCFAWFSTRRLLKQLDRLNPDVLHLHNLHDSYINLPMLFHWIKSRKIKVIWTLHDCWSFTGHCPHFTLSGCQRWKEGCGHCPQLGTYPALLRDTTAWLWRKKRQWFNGVEDLTIVTPSKWLADLVKESFLRDYPVLVINNGIDLNTFRPLDSDFREKHGFAPRGAAEPVPGKPRHLVLGVSFGWLHSKGLDVFEDLSARLGEDYRVVLVGTDAALDEHLPRNILSIHRTHDQRELAEIYAAADVFVNPTREDNFPTVNLEALACGTPVVTFATGGSPECIDERCGSVVAVDDNDALLREVVRVCEQRPFRREDCTARAAQLEREAQFACYLPLYERCASATAPQG